MSQTTFTTTATATYATGNTVAVASAVNMFSGLPIVFTGNTFGGITAGSTYYIGTIVPGYPTSTITLATLPGGTIFGLSTATGNMTATFNQGGQQIIPTVAPGEPLNQAFTAVNTNFDQIFAAGPVGSNIQIVNGSILTTNTNGNLILNPNGIGNVVATSHVVPDQTRVRNLGSATQRWNTVYSQYANSTQLNVTGDASISGNLTVTGNTIEIGNIVTDSLTIQLANTISNASLATGAGITVGANNNIATILFDSGNSAWATNVGLEVNGTISGTGISASSATIYSNLAAGTITAGDIDAGNVLPGVNAAFTIGNANLQWRDGYFSNSVSAGYFLGNGALLTGINVSSNQIFNGTSNVSIPIANGNVYINGSTGYQWTFDNTGNLTLPASGLNLSGPGSLHGPGNIAPEFFGPGVTINANTDSGAYYSLLNIGNTTNINQGDMYVARGGGNSVYGGIDTSDGNGNTWTWIFGTDGSTANPGNLYINATNWIGLNGSDANWRMGYGLNAFTTNIANSQTAVEVVIGTGTAGPDSFAVGQTGGASIFELVGHTQNAYFANNVTVTANVTANNVNATGNVVAGNVILPAGGEVVLDSATGNAYIAQTMGLQIAGEGGINFTINDGAGNITNAGFDVYADFSTPGSISAAGNVTGGNVLAAGLYTSVISATGIVYVDSTGKLTGDAAGLSTDGNGNVSAYGNVTAGGFVTTGSGGNITGANVISANEFVTPYSTLNNGLSTSGNIISVDISATGNITGSNVVSTGNLFLTTGNIDTSNATGYLFDAGPTSIRIGTYNASNITIGTAPSQTVIQGSARVTANIGTNLTGALLVDADYVYTPTNQQGVMLQVQGQTDQPTRVYIDGGGANNYAAIIGRHYNGNTVTPTQVLANSVVARYGATPYTSNGWPFLSTTRVDMVTLEDQTPTAQGSQIRLWTTPRGSNVITQAATIDTTGISVTGNITGNYILGNGSQLTGIQITSTEPNFTIQTGNFVATTGSRYGVNTVSNAVTATLPATPATGGAIFFADAGGAFATNNLIINPNGGTIMGASGNMTVSTNNQSFGLFYNGTTWRTYNAG